MSVSTEIKLSSNGVVINEGVHDAAIIDVKLSGEDENVNAIISCRSEKGEVFNFKFSAVRLFDLSFFGSQNVIRDFLVLTNVDAEDFVRDLKDLEKYTFEKYANLSNLVKQGSLIFARFAPAVGAQITIICKNVELLSI